MTNPSDYQRGYDQLDKRVGDLRTDMNERFGEMRSDMNERFGEMRSDMNEMRTDMRAGFVRVDQRFSQMDLRFESIDRKIDGNFKALIGWMLGQTAVIVGSLTAVALALHH